MPPVGSWTGRFRKSTRSSDSVLFLWTGMWVGSNWDTLMEGEL